MLHRRSAPSRSPVARLPWALALLALVPAAGCGGSPAGRPPSADPRERNASEPLSVAATPVRRSDMVSTYGTSATLRAQARATVTSRTRGVIEELFVEEGDAVAAGQVLAKLEDAEQRLARTRAESVHDIKQREFKRQTELKQQSIISDNEFELIRRETEEARLDLELAQLELERTSIRSPFEGIVVLRHLDLGATVSDGTAIFDVADVDPLYADISVPERHVEQLAPEQIVRLTADGLEHPVEARIERLAPVVNAATGTVKVTVAVSGVVALRPGAFVEVQIVTDVHHDVLVVPRSALVAEGRRWQVFRPVEAEKGGTVVEAIEVRLGFEEGDRVEIEPTGERVLAAGDLVVSVGASALSDGAAVRVLERGVRTAGLDETRDEDGAADGTGEAAAATRE